MKTNPSLLGHRKEKKSLADLVEWAALLVLLAVIGYYFLSSNGFIDSSSIQPYPY